MQIGTEIDDHIFFKACGDWSNKRTIYRQDRDKTSMFEKPSRSKRFQFDYVICVHLTVGYPVSRSIANHPIRASNHQSSSILVRRDADATMQLDN